MCICVAFVDGIRMVLHVMMRKECAKNAQTRSARSMERHPHPHLSKSKHQTLKTFDERIDDVVCFINN